MCTKITFWGNAKNILTKDYFNFQGVATRQMYCYFVLFNIMNAFILCISLFIYAGNIYASGMNAEQQVDENTGLAFATMSPVMIYSIYAIIPSIALFSRRIRDIGIKNSIVIVLIYLSRILLIFIFAVLLDASDDAIVGIVFFLVLMLFIIGIAILPSKFFERKNN